MLNQLAVYDALSTRMAQLDLNLLLGEPTAIHTTPAAYLMAFAAAYRRIGKVTVADLRPKLRVLVAFQSAPEAERELLGLSDSVISALLEEPLDAACRAYVENIEYGYVTIGSTQYRLADHNLLIYQS